MRFKQVIQRVLRDDSGAELGEYAVGVALLVAIAIVVYNVLGRAINDENTGTAAQVKAASGSAFK